MLIYFALLLIGIILYYNDKFNTKSAVLLMLLMFLITGLRDVSIGIDTESYMMEYHYMTSDARREPLFVLSISLMKSINASDNTWLMFVSFLIYLPYTYAIVKYSKVPVMSALLFMVSSSLFFLDGMNGIRQWIASGFALLAFILRSRGNLVKSLACVLLAVGFHLSSIIILPFLFVKGIKLDKIVAYGIVVVSAMIGFMLSNMDISSFTDDYVALVSGYGGYGSEKLMSYSNLGYLENTTNWKYYLLCILPISAICISSYYNHPLNAEAAEKKRRMIFKIKPDNWYLYTIFIIAIPLLNIASTAIAYGHRLAFAFITTQLICMPEAYARGSKKQRSVINIVVFYFLLFFIYYVIKNNGARIGSVVPYKFFFE